MSALPNLFPPYGVLFANPAGGISILNPGGAGGVLTSAGNASPVYMTLPVVCVNQPGIGVVMDGQTDNSAALASIISRYPKGGTFLFPPGVCLFSQPWTFNQKANFRFVGAGSNQSGGAAATSLVYTGSGPASAIAGLSSRGIKLEGLCFQWDNPGFTGYLLDFGPFSLTSGDSANITVEDCNLRPTSTSLTCAALLKLGWNYNFTASRCQFWGGQYNILGRASASEFTNTVLLQQCNFGGAVVAAIRNAQQCWKLHVCVIEPNASGAAAGLVWDAATPGEQITLDGCWMGDDSGQEAGAWIDWHGGKGLYIFGGFMGLEALTTGIRVSANASQGIFIEGLQVQGGGGNSTLIDFGSTTGHTSFYFFPANFPNGVSNGILGTIPPGVYDLGSGPVFTGATFAGTLGAEALVITGSATVGTLNVTETPANPNMLSAASADFETGVGVWSANSNCTLATTTAAALHGMHSLQVTFADDGPPLTTMSINSIGAGWSGQVPIQPGQTWTCLASFYCPPGSAPRLLEIDFYATSSSGGANYQRLATTGDAIREVVASWVPLHLTVTIPATLPVGGATPAFGSMVFRWVDSGNLTVGEIHLVDCVQLAQGLSPEWQDPAESSSNIQISGNTIAQVGSNGANDIAVLAQNGGTAYVNFGSGAGTGGVHLGTPVAEG